MDISIGAHRVVNCDCISALGWDPLATPLGECAVDVAERQSATARALKHATDPK